MKKIYFALLTISLFSLLWISCNTNDKNEIIEEKKNVEDVVLVLEDTSTRFLFPSPLQIAELFKNAGLVFVGDLVNKKENISKYNTKYSQKLNFGVYAADMSYCVINNQTQPAIDYLNNLHSLSEKMWMTDVFSTMGMNARLETNIGNVDSLTLLMADIQAQLDNYLDENAMGYTAPIIFAGAWIETMFIGAEVNKTQSNEKLIFRLSEQAVVLADLINALKKADEDGDYVELITDLEKIKINFGNITEDENTTLNETQIVALTNDIVALRNKIIN